ncbi:MAG TPA: hypothetical protein VIV27_03150 [Halioglobus sp.]
MKKADGKNSQGESKRAQRKPYNSPKLSNFGSIAQVTQSHGQGPIDDRGMNTMAAS